MSVSYENVLENYLLRGYSPEEAASLAAQFVKAAGGTPPPMPSLEEVWTRRRALEEKYGKITTTATTTGPRAIMTKEQYNEMIRKYGDNPSKCALGQWPVHFEGPDDKVYFFNTIQELIDFQKRMWPELYDPNSPQFKARITLEKAKTEFVNQFNQAYGNYMSYGQLTDVLEQAKQKGLEVLEKTGNLSLASEEAAKIALPAIQAYAQQHPGAVLADMLNKGKVTAEEVQQLSKGYNIAKQAYQPTTTPTATTLAILAGMAILIGVVAWKG